MAVQDAFQAIDSLEPETIAKFVTRLEQRGCNPTFSSWRDAYLDLLDLGAAANAIKARATFTHWSWQPVPR